MYLATFPKDWTETFDGSKDINNTSYEEINCFMEKQKEKADKEHTKKERRKRKRKKKRRKLKVVVVAAGAASTNSIQRRIFSSTFQVLDFNCF